MLLNEFFNIINTETVGEYLTTQIRLNPGHEIFKAHFPGKPVVPGVCQIQIISEIIAAQIHCEVILTDAKNVKYLLPIDPRKTHELIVKITLTAHKDDFYKATATFTCNEQIYSKMTLTYHVVRNNSNIQ